MGALPKAMEAISEGSGEITLVALNVNRNATSTRKDFAMFAEDLRSFTVRLAEALKESDTVLGSSAASRTLEL